MTRIKWRSALYREVQVLVHGVLLLKQLRLYPVGPPYKTGDSALFFGSNLNRCPQGTICGNRSRATEFATTRHTNLLVIETNERIRSSVFEVVTPVREHSDAHSSFCAQFLSCPQILSPCNDIVRGRQNGGSNMTSFCHVVQMARGLLCGRSGG